MKTYSHDDAGGDHHIPPLRSDQMIVAMATASCLMINHCSHGELKAAQALFATFVFQLAAFSEHPSTMAALLRITADEMDWRATENGCGNG